MRLPLHKDLMSRPIRWIGYGSYGLDDQTEINFQFDAGINHNKGKREIEFVSAEASSDYISYSAHTVVGIGRIFYLWLRTSISPSRLYLDQGQSLF